MNFLGDHGRAHSDLRQVQFPATAVNSPVQMKTYRSNDQSAQKGASIKWQAEE